jgi:hypothetical protein
MCTFKISVINLHFSEIEASGTVSSIKPILPFHRHIPSTTITMWHISIQIDS